MLNRFGLDLMLAAVGLAVAETSVPRESSTRSDPPLPPRLGHALRAR